MAIKILSGPTGCGKTYQAFHRLGKKSAIYGAPCRQLVYETAEKYGDIHSSVKTSDVKIGHGAHRCFCTYECISIKDIRKYDVLIIDEAHFIEDEERGPHLMDLISFADKIGKEVILLSATLGVKIEGAKIINLPPRGAEFYKKRVTYTVARNRVDRGVPSLIFETTVSDCEWTAERLSKNGVKAAAITAKTSVADRVRLVHLFNSGKITCIVATNAMAQGVNICAENLIVNTNRYDDDQTIIQKFGRLGRTGVTKEGAKLTYWFDRCYTNKTIKNMSDALEQNQRSIKILRPENAGRVVDYDLRTPATDAEKERLSKLIIKSWETKI